MPIDPKTEEPLRTLLGHAIRGELDDVARMMVQTGDDRYRECLALCVQVSAYITIDVSRHWPSAADIREVAKVASEARTNLPVTENEIHEYLSRTVFGFERLDEVFTDEKKVGSVPLFALANLLLSFFPGGKHWSDYLDTIETGIDTAEKTRLLALPSLMYRHRAMGARSGKNIRPSSE